MWPTSVFSKTYYHHIVTVMLRFLLRGVHTVPVHCTVCWLGEEGRLWPAPGSLPQSTKHLEPTDRPAVQPQNCGAPAAVERKLKLADSLLLQCHHVHLSVAAISAYTQLTCVEYMLQHRAAHLCCNMVTSPLAIPAPLPTAAKAQVKL